VGLIRLLTMAGLGGVLWRAIQESERLPEPLSGWASDVKSSAEMSVIQWSAGFLRSRGAVQSAPLAQQEALLAQRVVCALREELGIKAGGISVIVIGSVIHLEGKVASVADRAEAERIARDASGAEILADDLQVAG